MNIKTKVFVLGLMCFGWFMVSGATASATTYYVASSGDDANACTTAQNIASPKRTVVSGVNCLTAGDTLLIRAGTYSESFWGNIPSGTSWSSPVTLKAYPRETVTLSPSSGERVIHFQGQQYIVIDGLVMDGRRVNTEVIKISSGGGKPAAHHIRIMNSELKNAPGQGILTSDGSRYNEFINIKVHDNGTDDFRHGIYISDGYNLIENSEIYRNSGWGIHIYGGESANNIVRNNKVYNNARVGTRGYGIGIYGPGNQVYNNIVWGNRGGLQLDCWACTGSGKGSFIYNNTFYNNGTDINIGPYFTGNVIKNNIVPKGISNGGVNTVMSNNLNSDAKFVNVASNDFHLQSSSPAINAGITIPGVLKDFDGVNRPIGSAYDIGAYEYGGTGGGTSPTPTPSTSLTPTPTASTTPTPTPGTLRGDLNNDRIVNSLDWSLMNAKWFTNDATADLNSDGIVNSLDFSIMNGNWLKTI